MFAAPEQPIVSVVIPCYNQALYLPQAVESVVDQTFPSWEAIIVDDGSPDDTAEVARRLAARYGPRIRVMTQTNQGVAAARNHAIAAANGRYILPLDADDEIAPTMLEETVRVLETDPRVAGVYVHVKGIGDRSGADTSGRLEFDRDILTVWNYVCGCSLFRKDAWERTGGYKTDMVFGYEDWDLWLGFAAAGFRLKRVPKQLSLVRATSSTRSATAQDHHAELMRLLASHHPHYFTRPRRALGRVKYFLHRVRRKASRTLGRRASG